MSALELQVALRERAAAHARAVFVCPDCEGDPHCPTCGEPTRGLVLFWLRVFLKGWLR